MRDFVTVSSLLPLPGDQPTKPDVRGWDRVRGGGWSDWAIESLTGSPAVQVSSETPDLYQRIKTSLEEGKLVVAGSGTRKAAEQRWQSQFGARPYGKLRQMFFHAAEERPFVDEVSYGHAYGVRFVSMEEAPDGRKAPYVLLYDRWRENSTLPGAEAGSYSMPLDEFVALFPAVYIGG